MAKCDADRGTTADEFMKLLQLLIKADLQNWEISVTVGVFSARVALVILHFFQQERNNKRSVTFCV
jgi:hypothetical protein